MIVTVANIKGGVGKSMISFNIGMYLYTSYEFDQSEPFTFCDLDPQGTLCDIVSVRKELGHTPDVPVVKTSLNEITKNTVIDVSIAEKLTMIEAIGKSDIVVVPCGPSQSEVWATQKFIDMVKLLYPSKKVYMFVNRADTHHSSKETGETSDVLSTFDGTLLKTRIHSRTAYRKSMSEGLAVFEMKGASNNKAINEFIDLAEEIFGE